MAPDKPQVNYFGKHVLAPMVRPNYIPFRMECLKYGADLVWSEELIDKRILNSVRTINKETGQIEYINLSDGSLVFSTTPEERDRLIFQLGTANPLLALRAALHVMEDVAAVDINMGCPKSFSVDQGMGAALLSTPQLARDIVRTLHDGLYAISGFQVSTKIRLLDNEPFEQTVEFAKGLVAAGSQCVTLHARLRTDRPRDRARWGAYSIVKAAINEGRETRIPLLANGDFFTQDDLNTVREGQGDDGPDGFMTARGAQMDPSCFSAEEAIKAKSGEETPMARLLRVAASYIRRCVETNNPFQNSKFVLQKMFEENGDANIRVGVNSSKSTRDLCIVLGEGAFWEAKAATMPAHWCTLVYHKKILETRKAELQAMHADQMAKIDSYIQDHACSIFVDGTPTSTSDLPAGYGESKRTPKGQPATSCLTKESLGQQESDAVKRPAPADSVADEETKAARIVTAQ